MQHRQAGRRRHPDLQLQRKLQPPGHGHNDRRDLTIRDADGVRPHPPLPTARTVPRRRRPSPQP